MSDHGGRIEQIVRAAFRSAGTPMDLIIVVREALAAEHAEGWREGYADGIRDVHDAERYGSGG